MKVYKSQGIGRVTGFQLTSFTLFHLRCTIKSRVVMFYFLISVKGTKMNMLVYYLHWNLKIIEIHSAFWKE